MECSCLWESRATHVWRTRGAHCGPWRPTTACAGCSWRCSARPWAAGRTAPRSVSSRSTRPAQRGVGVAFATPLISGALAAPLISVAADRFSARAGPGGGQSGAGRDRARDRARRRERALARRRDRAPVRDRDHLDARAPRDPGADAFARADAAGADRGERRRERNPERVDRDRSGAGRRAGGTGGSQRDVRRGRRALRSVRAARREAAAAADSRGSRPRSDSRSRSRWPGFARSPPTGRCGCSSACTPRRRSSAERSTC